MGIASTTNTVFLGVGQYPPPTVRGAYYTVSGEMVQNQRLPTDPFGHATLTIASETDLTGAEIRIYDLDQAQVNNLGTELAGTESCLTSTFTYAYSYGITPNLVWIQVMAPGYEEYGQRYTLPTRDTTLSVILQAELNT